MKTDSNPKVPESTAAEQASPPATLFRESTFRRLVIARYFLFIIFLFGASLGYGQIVVGLMWACWTLNVWILEDMYSRNAPHELPGAKNQDA